MELIKKIIDFIRVDVWRISLKNMPKYKLFLIRQLRVLLLAFRGYKEDKLGLRASALTYFSMMSVVPVVAMGFGIAKGFGFDKFLEKQLIQNFSGQQEVLDWIIKFAHSFLENTKGGIIAGIGIAILIWTVMKVLGNIESSFNAIWQIRTPRVWFRKFSDYLSMMLIAPILLILSTSANVFISTQLTRIMAEVDILGYISPIIFFLIKLIPYVLFWLVLTIIYMVMPNTKVNFKSAFVAGVIGGTIFVFVQWVYIHFQVGVSRYNAIYGSFAALPLFLIWLQTSWLIILFGAEISFAVQNVERYEFDPDIQNLSLFSERVLTLMVARLIVKRFENGEEPLTDKEISQKLEIPIRLVRDILFVLSESRILTELATQQYKEKAYQPAQDINKITVSYVLNAIDHNGVDKILAADSAEKDQIKKLLNDFDLAVQNAKGTMLLKDII
ncbi:MAG: YhjD/YihY/BrkB family envelope integrity protein [Bacteroidales bacterium]|jgi:membrane protein|nr:YhjD/YihY/BrkB family envelope integrity protein [Bacteroidales bacterium]